MPPKSKKKPTPQELLEEVKGQAPAQTYAFDDYLEVVHELKTKNNSYAEIAVFLATKLGIEVTRGQVFRSYKMWLDIRDHEEAENARLQEMADYHEGLDEEATANRALNLAALKVIDFARENIPDQSVPGGYLEAIRRALILLDSDLRDEHDAAEEDRRLKETENK